MQPRAKSTVFTVTICFRSFTAVFHFFPATILPQRNPKIYADTSLSDQLHSSQHDISMQDCSDNRIFLYGFRIEWRCFRDVVFRVPLFSFCNFNALSRRSSSALKTVSVNITLG